MYIHRYCSLYHKYDVRNVLEAVNMISCNNRVFSPYKFFPIGGDLNVESAYRNLQCLIEKYGFNPLNTGTLVCVAIRNSYDNYGMTIRDLIDIAAIFLTPEISTGCSDTEIYVSDEVRLLLK